MKIVIFLGFLIVGISKKNVVHGMEQSYRFSVRKLLTDWCALSCGENKNIACELGGKCHAQEPCHFGTVDKAKIVEAHNKLRDTFAAGKESRADGLTVANMVALSWDNDLAFTASCNVARCPADNMNHDKCHKTPKFSAGQNLWGSTGDNCLDNHLSAVQSWYDEIKLVDKTRILSDAKKYEFDHTTGHFTALIWATTTHIGCAITKKKKGAESFCALACNYGPAGNVMSGSMLTEGQPCSQCPENLQCGQTYTSLCGDGGVPDKSSNLNGIHTILGAFFYGLLLLSLAFFGK